MNSVEFVALLPYTVLTVGILVVLLVIPCQRNHKLTAVLSGGALGVTLLSIPFAASVIPQQVTVLMVVDGFALYFAALLVAATGAVCAMAFNYMQQRGGHREEIYLLFLLAALGSAVLAASSHFVSLFLGLELLTLSLYGIIAYLREDTPCLEAGIKYLILAAVSSAFLLFGMALVYADLGTMQLAQAAQTLAGGSVLDNPLVPVGLAVIFIGVGFKLALVPFHLWTPDIYQGASAPATAFVASVSKGGMFAVLIRYFTPMEAGDFPALYAALVIIAIASMFAGNWLALMQNNVKRILAYSSIAHLGYLMVAVIAAQPIAVTAAAFYITAYMVTTLVAFGIVSMLSTADGDAENLSDYQGLYWRRPWLAGIFTFALLSLAGIPLTGGFIGKFYVAAAGVGSAEWLLVLALVLSSSIGVFYYLRIIVTMISQLGEAPAPVHPLPIPWTGSITLALLTVLLAWMGTLPASWVTWIEALTRDMTAAMF